eukprot:Skav217844  [mRNA]  locus=scaffold3024:55971:57284:+ [translate_table: standard]
MSRWSRSGPVNRLNPGGYGKYASVQETMYLQMQGPQKPLPRIPPAFPRGTFGGSTDATGSRGTSKVGGLGGEVEEVGVGGVGGIGVAAPKLPSRPGNSTAGLLSILAVGATTMMTQFRPSKRLSHMRRARMARRFRSYQWEEAGKDGREVRLYIPVDQTIKETNVEIDLSESKLRVGLLNGPPVIDSDLYDSVHPHESHWFIDRHGGSACVAVTLMKKNIWTQWPVLTTQEAAGLRTLFLAKVMAACFLMVVVLQQLTHG